MNSQGTFKELKENAQSEKFLFYEDKDFTLYKGKMQDVLSTFEQNSIDSIVCDPPYELNFMGKGWDNQGIAFKKDTWEHCYKTLKPGGYLLAFGGSRTFHRIALWEAVAQVRLACLKIVKEMLIIIL